jgi:hypothetical protein
MVAEPVSLPWPIAPDEPAEGDPVEFDKIDLDI